MEFLSVRLCSDIATQKVCEWCKKMLYVYKAFVFLICEQNIFKATYIEFVKPRHGK
jgi:hypothetical protein